MERIENESIIIFCFFDSCLQREIICKITLGIIKIIETIGNNSVAPKKPKKEIRSLM